MNIQSTTSRNAWKIRAYYFFKFFVAWLSTGGRDLKLSPPRNNCHIWATVFLGIPSMAAFLIALALVILIGGVLIFAVAKGSYLALFDWGPAGHLPRVVIGSIGGIVAFVVLATIALNYLAQPIERLRQRMARWGQCQPIVLAD